MARVLYLLFFYYREEGFLKYMCHCFTPFKPLHIPVIDALRCKKCKKYTRYIIFLQSKYCNSK